MSWFSLADFVDDLGQAGQLVRVGVRVEAALEVAEITCRVAHWGGPALLFGQVDGHEVPVLTNLLGTEGRVCQALGIRSLEELSQRIAELVEPQEPEGWFERIKAAPARAMLKKLAPKIVRTGLCQQVVRPGGDVDLGQLPAIQSWPDEAGPTITAGRLFTCDATAGRMTVGRYDLRVLGQNRLAVCWHPHDDPARLLARYRQRNERMPVAVVLGGDPAGLLAAMAPLPPNVDVCAVAGLLGGKVCELVPCRTVPLHVPSDAEIVVEGYIDPGGPPSDPGPLGTSGGYYRLPRPAPVVQVTAVTHRLNPIWPAMVPGRPPDEACTVRRALQRIFLPLVRLAIPELIDCDLPAFGAARHWAFLSVRKDYAGQARKVACAAWGLRPLMFTKTLVVVDEEVDVRDSRQVWSAIAAHVDPGCDVFFQEGPTDPWDPAAPPDRPSRRMAIDATRKLPEERRGSQTKETTSSDELRRLVSRRWAEYGLGPEPDRT